MGIREEIQLEINEALRTDLSDASTSIVLMKKVADGGARPSAMAKKSAAWESHPAFGVVEHEWNAHQADGDRVRITDRGFLILSCNIEVVPSVDDRIQLETGETLTVTHVSSDPVKAAYDLAARKLT